MKKYLYVSGVLTGLTLLFAAPVHTLAAPTCSPACASNEKCYSAGFQGSVEMGYCAVDYSHAIGGGGTTPAPATSTAPGGSSCVVGQNGSQCCSDSDCNVPGGFHCIESPNGNSSYCSLNAQGPVAGNTSSTQGALNSQAQCVPGSMYNTSPYGDGVVYTGCLDKITGLYINVCMGNETAGVCAPARIDAAAAAAAAKAVGPGCVALYNTMGAGIDPNTGLNYFYSTVCPGDNGYPGTGAGAGTGSGARTGTGTGANLGALGGTAASGAGSAALTNLQLQLVNLLKAQVTSLQNQVATRRTAGTVANLGGSTSGGASTGVGATNAAPAPISIEIAPATRNIASAGSVTYKITVHSDFGADLPVTLSLSGLPKGASAFFDPEQVSSDNGVSTLTVNVTSLAAIDLYAFRVTGTMGDGSIKSSSASIAIGATKNLDPVGSIVAPPANTKVFGSGVKTVPSATGSPAATPTSPVVCIGRAPVSGGTDVFFSANCGSDITVSVGDLVTYVWSTNAPAATSTYFMPFGTDSCYTPARTPQAYYPWYVSNTSGTMTATVAPCQAGATYTVNYTAVPASGATLSAQVIVRVRPLGATMTVPPPATGPSTTPLPTTSAGSPPVITQSSATSGTTPPIIANTQTKTGPFVTAKRVAVSRGVLSQIAQNDPYNDVLLTANGQHDLTVAPGDPITFKWGATRNGASPANNASASSTYQVDATDQCGNQGGDTVYAWVANTLNGTVTASVDPCQLGRIYTIIFAVTDEAGNVYGDSVIVRVSATSSSVSTSYQDTIGVYDWSPKPGSTKPLADGVALAVSQGYKIIRFSMSPRFNADYGLSQDCMANFSLAGLAASDQVKPVLLDPKISTYIITAYDGVSFPDCNTKLYFDPTFYTQSNITKMVKDYSDLVFYLYQLDQNTGKKFILSNWEGDNDLYCQDAYGYATNAAVRDLCNKNYPNYYNGSTGVDTPISAMKLWFKYRDQGIRDGRARAAAAGLGGISVSSAVETTSVNTLHDNGFKGMLYDVAPYVPLDYLSYSSYESINQSDPVTALTNSMQRIRDVLGSPKIIIGEFGFDANAWGITQAKAHLRQTADTLRAAGASYGIVWQLFDYPSGYGLYSNSGEPKTRDAFEPAAPALTQ